MTKPKTTPVSMEILGQTHTLKPATTPKAPAKKAPVKSPAKATPTQAKAEPKAKPETVKAKPEQPQYLNIKGTAKEIMEKGVVLNGKYVDSVALSVLAKFGTIKEVGKESRPVGSMGRAGTIYELQGKSGFKLEIKGAQVKPQPAPQKAQETPKTETQSAGPTTPLEALQSAVNTPEGVQITLPAESLAKLPMGFDHARAMGLN